MIHQGLLPPGSKLAANRVRDPIRVDAGPYTFESKNRRRQLAPIFVEGES